MAETVIVSKAEYEALLARLEDLEDIVAAGARTGLTLPAAFADRIIDGESPLRVWRDYRGLSLQALSEQCGLAAGEIAQIEQGIVTGSVASYNALANALETTVDWLIA